MILDGMNVIIPIGGIGSRFRKLGYRYPKPFINIVGRPMLFWIIDRLSLRPSDTLWIAISAQVAQDLLVEALLLKEYPNLDIKIIPLAFNTCGAAETLYIVTSSMDEKYWQRKTISLDCDTIYTNDILETIRSLPPQVSACVCFEDDSDKAIYSYIKVNESGYIQDIKEKVPISKNANTGAYCFSNAAILRCYAGKIISNKLPDTKTGEYYTSAVILKMIQDDCRFMAIQVPKSDFYCVGTPDQLSAFLQTIRLNQSLIKARRFCFDLDGTLVTLPKKKGDYSTVEPIVKNILLLRELKDSGNYIIIQTARRMRTHNGNIGAVIKDIGQITFETLDKFEIPFDEIVFGKPFAHIYVDDLAVNALMDTRKELGWLELPRKQTPREMVECRSMNLVQIVGENVVKSSRSNELIGEIYFHTHMPNDIAYLFPKLIGDPSFASDTFTICMELIQGTSLSHLFTHNALTPERFQKFMDALFAIHSSNGICSERELLPPFDLLFHKDQPKQNIYANYTSKVEARYSKFYESIYRHLDDTVSDFYQKLIQKLTEYEQNNQGIHAKVIHGDPVFSNIILTPQGEFKFLDMRGCIGLEYTTAGDVLYDLAKVYQSLLGYDFVLLDKGKTKVKNLLGPIQERNMSELRTMFWDIVKKRYGIAQDGPIKYLTAGLYFSMLPFHDSCLHSNFYQLALCSFA